MLTMGTVNGSRRKPFRFLYHFIETNDFRFPRNEKKSKDRFFQSAKIHPLLGTFMILHFSI